MEDIDKTVFNMLVPIFPNLTQEVIEVSVRHPSNHGVPLTEDVLLQRCIDDLLELRTFTEQSLKNKSVAKFFSYDAKKANKSPNPATYRQPADIVRSDESSDSDKDTTNEDQTTISINVGVDSPASALQESPEKNKAVMIRGHFPAKDVVVINSTTKTNKETSDIKVCKKNNMKKETNSNSMKTGSVESSEEKLINNDMYREIDFSSDSNSSDLLAGSNLLYSSDEEQDLPLLSSPMIPLRPSPLKLKAPNVSCGPDFSTWRDTVSKSSTSAVAADKSIIGGRNLLQKSQTVPEVIPSNTLSKPENRGVTATVNVNNNRDMNIDITVNVSASSGKKSDQNLLNQVPSTRPAVQQTHQPTSSPLNTASNKPGPPGLQPRKRQLNAPALPSLSKPHLPSSFSIENISRNTAVTVDKEPVTRSGISVPSSMLYTDLPMQRNPLMSVSYPKPSDPLKIKISNKAAGSPLLKAPSAIPHPSTAVIPNNPRIFIASRPMVTSTVTRPVERIVPPFGQRDRPSGTVPDSSHVTPGIRAPVRPAGVISQPANAMTIPNVYQTNPVHKIYVPNMPVVQENPVNVRKQTLPPAVIKTLQKNYPPSTAYNALEIPPVTAGGFTAASTAGPSSTTQSKNINYPQTTAATVKVPNIDLSSEPVIIAEQRAEQVIIPDKEVETPELIPEEKENQDIVFEEAETPEMRTKKAKDNLRKEMVLMFPDVDPNYVDQLYDRYQIMQNWQNIINNVCNHLLEDPNYPKEAKAPVTVPQVVQKPSIDYYNEFSSSVDGTYTVQCEQLLMSEFKWISLKDIRKIMRCFKGHYSPSHKVLTQAMMNRMEEYSKREKHLNTFVHPYSYANTVVKFKGVDGETALAMTFLKSARPIRSEAIVCPALQLEKEYVNIKTEEEKKEKDRELAVSVNEHEYEESGQLIECGCCYGEVAFEMMVQCYDGHLFCKECLERYAQESVFGHGKADLLCMTEGCDASYPTSQLQKALPNNILSKYEDRVQEENINLADLADLVRCPHCDFAALMDPGDKVFKCHNTTCLKETCRYCQEEWKEHFGKRCDEIEKKDEVKLRLQFEEKMTAAKIRTCHKCKAKFTKSDGCNKMTCRCGAKMCYICRIPNIDYDHFCRHFRDPNKGKACTECSACSLWTNPEQDDERAVAEIKKEAEETRKVMGYTEEKLIGAPDEPPSKKKCIGQGQVHVV